MNRPNLFYKIFIQRTTSWRRILIDLPNKSFHTVAYKSVREFHSGFRQLKKIKHIVVPF